MTRSDLRPPPGTALPRHFAGCFGCGDLEGGLRLRFTTGPDLTVTSTFTVPTHHQGAPGIAHGGVIAAVFDETLGVLQAFFPDERAVTANLSITYRRPIPVGSELHLTGSVDGREGRKLTVSGAARLDSAGGPVAATATGLFVFVPEEHFAPYAPTE